MFHMYACVGVHMHSPETQPATRYSNGNPRSMLFSDILTDTGVIPVIECYFMFFPQKYSLRYKNDKQNTENKNEYSE